MFVWLPVDYIHNYTAAQVTNEMQGVQPVRQAGPADDHAVEEPLHIQVPYHWLAKCDLRVRVDDYLGEQTPHLGELPLNHQVTGYQEARLVAVDVWKIILS